MARSSEQKRKLLILCQYLLRHSDEEHPVTITEMLGELSRWGISAERKSVYADMEELRRFGLDVQSRKGRNAGWFVGEREFEQAELKLLVDAVQSSRFLTVKKSAGLIRKLEGLTSEYGAGQLQRQVYVDRRVKTMNESIFYNVDQLHGAIASNRAVSFLYFEYNMRKERVFRHGGRRYQVSPCGLIWDSENYYLAGWDQVRAEVRHYRVDKMADIKETAEPRYVPPDWDPEGYTRRHFNMYSGRKGQVRLRCTARMAGVVLDRFGQDIIMVPEGEDYFTVMLDVVVSPPFWGWLFTLGEGVEVLSPDWARAEFQQRLTKIAAHYSNDTEPEQSTEVISARESADTTGSQV